MLAGSREGLAGRKLEVLAMTDGMVLYGTVPEAFKRSGDGDGYGSGDGDGYGSGSGDGYGSGSGDGSGYGYGDGDGSGYGYGYGYGSGDGYGDGSGYGDGYGYGSGDGSGDGDGYGYGYGSGDGYGYGSGSGDGYGYGYGYGSGDGDGYGYGYGYGSGDGSKEYWATVMHAFTNKWTDAQKSRLAALAETATIAYWRSDAAGRPCNGGAGKAVAIGDMQKIPGPLRLCGAGALHATATPPAWQGDRIWIVAMIGEVKWDGDKCGALEREIIGECL
jgi:hypothetical protein